MGPIGTKRALGKQWSPSGQRPRVKANYGKRGSLWVFGALEPATGEVMTLIRERRCGSDFLAFLEAVVEHWPHEDLIVILDNLNVHKMLDVQLWAVVHERVRFLFQPAYAPWLNLIEPWWKTLRLLALKGRSFSSVDEMVTALQQATAYWNNHRHPYVWRKAA
jgi:transposase